MPCSRTKPDVLNPEEEDNSEASGREQQALDITAKANMRKVRSSLAQLNCLVKGAPNTAYEADRVEDQASYSFIIETGELVNLDDIVQKQRMVETQFEA